MIQYALWTISEHSLALSAFRLLALFPVCYICGVAIKKKLLERMKSNDYIAYAHMLIGVLQTRMSLFKEAAENLHFAQEYYVTVLGADSYEAQFISKIFDDPNKRMEDYFE